MATTSKPRSNLSAYRAVNKTQQEMRWTNHPRIFLEVAVVKLCQLERSYC